VTARPGGTGPKPLPSGLNLPDMDQAVCKGKDPAPWFPHTGQSPKAGQALCRACPARRRCLEWALAKGERHGTWGGATPDERAQIIRQRRIRQKAIRATPPTVDAEDSRTAAVSPVSVPIPG
jgi:WhiB family transcriptional regulator, redox-sensing transcriptional regulator